jgi:hypothetical protein
MPEALLSGTPVLAFRQGSVPEILVDGETGFIRNTEDELVAAVDRLADLDRARCRAEAERRFSPSMMAQAYERVYAEIIHRYGALARQRAAKGAAAGKHSLARHPHLIPSMPVRRTTSLADAMFAPEEPLAEAADTIRTS